jgi:hypothetical protein
MEIAVLVLRATKRALVTTMRKNPHQNKVLINVEREFCVVLHYSDVKITSEQINEQIFVWTEQMFD